MITAIAILLALLWGLDALRMRARVAALPRLAPTDEPVDPAHRFVGVALDEATRRAASAHARRHGLEVLDLVPEDLPAWRALLFAGAVDPRSYRQSRIAPGRSAGAALLVTAPLHDKVGAPTADLFAYAARLKRHAPTTTDVAVAPALPLPDDLATRRALLAALFGDTVPTLLLVQSALVLLALAGPFLAPVAGGVALALLHLQALIATAGSALRPRGLLAFTLLRAPLDLLGAARLLARPTTRRAQAVAALRPTYQALTGDGLERFFEPRRDDCPLCASRELGVRIATGDLLQHKPGRFVLEECGACGHVFQNPRLSTAGLDFYYRDFYDGLNEARAEALFGFGPEPYLARARAVGEVAPRPPERWLDVGAGHGHFCNVARDLLPGARFDGLDLSDGIDEAARRGWIDRGYRGLFPDLAPSLAGAYDVVSMSHYLEHTRDPRAELRAAATVLPAGGHLMIEIPDPECRLGRLLGRFWVPWFQPQHQHLLSVARLERLLAEEGFAPVRVQRGEAHIPLDFRAATMLVLGRLAPAADLPWRPAPGALRRLLGAPYWVAGGLLLAAAHVADRALAPAFRRPGWSNAFRVVARRV